MSRVEEALFGIDIATEALELMVRKETVDFVSTECILMLAGWICDELAAQTSILKTEIQRDGRKIA